MARLQIVTLPTLTVGSMSVPEYLIVLDEVDDELVDDLIRASSEHFVNLKEATGARGILVFHHTIEVVR